MYLWHSFLKYIPQIKKTLKSKIKRSFALKLSCIGSDIGKLQKKKMQLQVGPIMYVCMLFYRPYCYSRRHKKIYCNANDLTYWILEGLLHIVKFWQYSIYTWYLRIKKCYSKFQCLKIYLIIFIKGLQWQS